VSRPHRPRQAPRAEPTTDVTRFRGLAVAAIAAAVVAGAAAVGLRAGPDLGGAPGPLPLPHRRAALTCDACHREDRSIVAACTGCHGAHRSTRAGHQRLARRGELGCPACHAGHGGEGGGVVFGADGTALRYGPGGALPVAFTRYRPAAGEPSSAHVNVPIVPLAACARCHDPGSARDPVHDCLIVGQEGLGARRPTVCFDEHRPTGRESGDLAARSAAWEAAREVAGRAPLAPAATSAPLLGRPLVWLLLAGVAAALAWILAGLLARAGARRSRLVASLATPETSRGGASASSAEPGAEVAAPPAVPRLPVIDAATCLGCHACVDACPYDVLEVRRYVAQVARPADCCGLTLCEQRCPNGSLVMVERSAGSPAPASMAAPVRDSLESRDVPGLYLAGDLTGLGLIRNAVNQGALAVRAVAADLRARPAADGQLDLVIVGVGPAGLSAALEARAIGLRALALEQATVAESIRSFPRGKLVLDPDLPSHGRLWLAETTKEELVARWLTAVRSEQPAILEGRRVTSIAREPAGFAVTTLAGDGGLGVYRTARLLLAIGRRGTPRLLDVPVPPSWIDRVHYSLADARSFAGQRVAVVGLGDVAMEAAVALSRQPGTSVTVIARAADFTRGKARNIDELRRRIAAGAVRMVWRGEVTGFGPGALAVSTPTEPVEIPCDAALIFIGSIASRALLADLGIAPQETGFAPGSFQPDEPARPADRPEETRS
jgi:thioredoxin reductase/NAD-dependent dihydropyrimidine dehydrogenase PreA subunit